MRFKSLSLALLLIVSLALTLSPKAFAQTTAQIHGTVTDPTGAVIPGAKIVARNNGTGISTTQTTNNSGYFVIPALTNGRYTVTISKDGFQSYRQLGVILRVGDQRQIDASLKPSSVATTIQVNANALQVETSNTELRDTITAKQIETLPSLGRNPEYYQKLMPGTVESSDRFGNYSSNGSQTQENSYLLDGADINDAPLQSEGVSVNPDALSEVEVVTSTLNPQYSRNSGAIVNDTIKNGTNQFHGDGFEFYRDTFMNNGNYFSPVRPTYHQNEYGGTLGGPVLKKKLFFFLAYQGYRRSTAVTTLTAVPTNDQLGRNGSGIADLSGDYNDVSGGNNNAAGLSSNPIPFGIIGNNGAQCGPGTANTTWAACFPNGTVNIPTSDFNPIAAKLLKNYVPSPNYQGSYYNFNAPNTAAEDQGVIRLDYQVTQKDLLWADTVFQSSPFTDALPFDGATLEGFTENNAEHYKIFSAAWTHTFNANTLNELRAGYFRFNYADVEPATVQQPSTYGFDITPQHPSAASLPFIAVSGYFDLGFSPYGPQPRIDTNERFSDTLTRIQGNHSLKFGASVERFSVHNPYYAQNNGSYGFSGSGTFTSGDPLLDYVLGIPSSYAQGSGAEIDARAWEEYFFAQDSWKATSSLTINYGVGYDIETPWADLQYNRLAMICFSPGAQSKIFPTAQASLLYPGDAGCNDMGGTSTKYDHLTPRFGFDWSPSQSLGWLTGPAGSHKFALRGGFGVYFNRDSEEAQLQNLEDPPFGLSTTGAGDVGGSPSFANPFEDVAGRKAYSEANKFPYTFPKAGDTNIDFSSLAPYDISTVSPKYSVPYTMNFNLQIQRQLPGDQVASIAYVGSLGRHLVRDYEADRITGAGHAAAVAACQKMGTSACLANAADLSYFDPQYFRETSGNFLSVGRVYTNGSSNYNSLQLELKKAESHGLFYQLSYTWSHALDNASGFETGFGNSYDLTGTNWVPGFQYLSYGNSEYDARNRFVAAYGYQIPIGARLKRNRIAAEALYGWNIVGITTLQSGFPVSIGETGTNRSLYCNGASYSFYSCPDTPETSTYNIQLRNPRKLYGGQHYWFNPAPFSPEPIGTFGNVKRNFLRGPGYNYTDLSLYKNFALGQPGGPRYIQLMIQAFNAFNHPNFARPDGNLSDGAQFGTITSVKQPVLGGDDPQPGRAVQLVGRIYF